ncbi:MAG TPA: acyl-CoA dehydrogenase family protein [Oligoflexia bacterium]|mgnify:CR=1 FL=1|nr:acyl-CoA dehydrogenase family protein [Oligoflexia bacterium]HMP27674.1 acyl-CoA dehydrogenase family protein [Oligoflexia bacterium]
MIKIASSEKSANLVAEFRKWYEQNGPAPQASLNNLSNFVSISRQWQSKLASARFVGVHWPTEFGGRGLSLIEEAAMQEEFVRIGAPQLVGLFGLTMVGPILLKHGSREQQNKYLSNILSANKIWCQGFSEPSAGSDLANIKCFAKQLSNGDFEISGQKVWTSFAQTADYCFLLARTSQEESKHKGLTYFLLPMKSNGITIRPLRQITGEEEFNEVFFDKTIVKQDAVVGKIGEGWKIAISTLMHERVILTFARQLQSETILRELLLKTSAKNEYNTLANLAKHIANSCAVRALAFEHLRSYAGGKEPGAEGSLDKLLWSENFQTLTAFALENESKDLARDVKSDLFCSSTLSNYLYSRGRTIAAGTSEIQRAIIAERILALPKTR